MDRLTSIEVFVRAVALGSFAAVAEERGISAQMVGKHVRGLEADVGATLLAKSTRYQALTAAGEQYHARCLVVLAELKAAQEDIYTHLNEPCGRLKMACGVNVGISALAPLLARFQQRYPQLEIDLTLDNSPPDVKKESYDVIFRERVDGYEYLVATKLCSYPMVLCATPDYLQRAGMPQRPEDLVHHPCLQSQSPLTLKHWRFWSPDGYITPPVSSRLTMNSGQALLAAALEGSGITLQPMFQVADALKNGELVALLPDYPVPEVDLYMLYKPSIRHTARLTLLMAYLREAVRDAQPS
ncbi:LysR substrate-binding domain-containing protein [Photobacterium japonica]|uniref:LysR family transcriptional regulator n=1 Tax=Photobacterium japonica TaxID=2910235 RepID=UPI003D1242EA